jgi:hypothetical protein
MRSFGRQSTGPYSECKILEQFYANTLRCSWLANHTPCANWEISRDKHDHQHAIVADAVLPEKDE